MSRYITSFEKLESFNTAAILYMTCTFQFANIFIQPIHTFMLLAWSLIIFVSHTPMVSSLYMEPKWTLLSLASVTLYMSPETKLNI